MSSPYTTFGVPADPVAWTALALGVAALGVAIRRPARLFERLERLPSRTVVGALAVTATLLSFGYVHHYLRGGPRIIDATSYLLGGRMLAEGALSFAVPEPASAFRGRFLLPTPAGELTVIFPPGYPALLALGFLAGVPLALGPLLAGALVIATYALAKALGAGENVARLSALLSAVCAALRYHTADTMSHGLAALLLTAGLAAAARASVLPAALSGLCIGWLVATRPVSGAVAAVLAIGLLSRAPRTWPAFGLALVPGLGLLLAHQRAATGDLWGSTQLAYYALADGPPGCFRYGFGPNTGCLFEHGDYVRARLPAGYGGVEALGNTLRRLTLHSVDIANAFPLAAVALYGAWRAWALPGLRVLTIGAVALIVAYAPFYFDGSYPGAGARMFAEALPLEHVLVALGLVQLGAARFALPLALLGFALHQSHAHLALRDREGGRPMFEPELLARHGVQRGLVFVETDHGFNLGHVPGSDGASSPIVARRRGDARDRLLWQSLGRPPAFLYVYDPRAPAASGRLLPHTPAPSQRFEAEGDWPPLAVAGWAHPVHVPCASNGRGLRVHPVDGRAAVALEIEATEPGRHFLRVGWFAERGQVPELTVRTNGTRAAARQQTPVGTPCGVSTIGPLELGRGVTRVWVEAPSELWIDYTDLVPDPSVRLDSPPEKR